MNRSRRRGAVGLVSVVTWWLLMAASAGYPPCGWAAEIAPKRIILPNGLTLLIIENHSLPIVTAHAIVKAGALYEPEEKSGLAHLAANLLEEGTTTRSAPQIAEEIDFVGATLFVSGEEDYVSVSLRILKKDVETGVDLLSDILLHPAFSQSEIDRKKKEIVGQIMAEKDEPGIVAEKAWRDAVFGRHPYHRPVEGREETLSTITREEIVSFHHRYYRPNNTILSLVGDITEKEVLSLVTKYAGAWQKAKIPFQSPPQAPPLTTKVVKLIDHDLTQANVILGHVGIKRANPDFYAVSVMNYILGSGGFSSRIMTSIRENAGLAYDVRSRFDASAHPGGFSITLQTKNESAPQAIAMALEEVRRIQNEPVTETELAEAQSFLIGSFPLRIDTNAKMASFLSTIEYYGLGLDYFEKYPDYIRRVTRKDVQRVAKKYLDPDHYVLVVVADQKKAHIK